MGSYYTSTPTRFILQLIKTNVLIDNKFYKNEQQPQVEWQQQCRWGESESNRSIERQFD